MGRSGLTGRAAGVLWASEVVLLQIRLGMGLLLRVARAKVGFLAGVASGDIAVMGRVQDIRRERIGVVDRHGGVKRGIVCKIDGRGDDVRAMEVVGGAAEIQARLQLSHRQLSGGWSCVAFKLAREWVHAPLSKRPFPQREGRLSVHR